MAIWSQLRHRNVVEFMGYRVDDSNSPTLISRWMENGTAFQYVTNNPQTDVYPLVRKGFDRLSRDAKWKIKVLGIAQGLDYLHYSGVVHSDIKSVGTWPKVPILLVLLAFRIIFSSLRLEYLKSVILACLEWAMLRSVYVIRRQTLSGDRYHGWR